jgi:outer membrane lipoprotein-sorting protein
MKKILLFLAISVMVFLKSLNAETLTVDQIVDKASIAAYYQGDDGKAFAKMTITDKQGRIRNREFNILRKDIEDNGRQKYYVYFYKPEDVRDMAYMVHKYLDKDDDRWLYLPALDLVKRIAASDKRSSFVGSNFVYEDVSGRGVTQDIHELISETDSSYLVKNVPKDKNSVDFSYWTVSIDKKTFLPLKAEYYDDKGEMYRMLEILKSEDIQGFPTPTIQKATDLRTGGETTIEFSNIQYNLNLKDDIFSERYLRKPPKEYLSR